jgi:hypothetical protein
MNAPILNSALRKVNKNNFTLAWILGIVTFIAIIVAVVYAYRYEKKHQKK